MIEHVWRGVSATDGIDRVIVATDDKRIADTVKAFGGEVMMTATTHRSGTDRCGEVIRTLGDEARLYDIVINVQGDEPRVAASQLQTVQALFNKPTTEIATLRKRIGNSSELFSPNVVKVVCSLQGDALYFSRQPIPHLRGSEQTAWLLQGSYFKHVGIYAFRREVLEQVVNLEPTPLELSESLEQLRWLENGFRITVGDTDVENISIDTPEDLNKLKVN